jgi:hypothetical protein
VLRFELLDPLLEEVLQDDFRSMDTRQSGGGKGCGETGLRGEPVDLERKGRASSANGGPFVFAPSFFDDEFVNRKTDFQL